MKSASQPVIEANRSYFDQNAHFYDADEPCMVEERSQQRQPIMEILILRLNMLFPNVPLRRLDAGGGSGNLAIKLVRFRTICSDLGNLPLFVGIFIPSHLFQFSVASSC